MRIVADILRSTNERTIKYGDVVLKRGLHGFVLGFSVRPESIKTMRDHIYHAIQDIISEGYDSVILNKKENFWLHATVAHNINRLSATKLLFSKDMILKSMHTLLTLDKLEYILQNYRLVSWIQRITLLNNKRRIVYEYDLYLDKILSRREALSRKIYQKSLKALRIKEGLELIKSNKKSDIFFISDLHLDHRNIIKYCARPFASVREMNKVLVSNWNGTVSEESEVYLLGDLTTYTSRINHWMRQLNGKITYVRGNHDKFGKEKVELKYEGYRFLLVHDPEKYVGKYRGWIIHGHKHNNDLFRYPFVNPETKTINVSVETIGYRPISISELINYLKRAEDLGEKLLVRPIT